MEKSPQSYFVYATQFILALGAYYFAARWSLDLTAVNTFAAPIWPPTGIALVAIYYGGYRLLPAIALGAFLANFQIGAPPLAALLIAGGNVLEASLGTMLLRNFRFQPFFNRLGDSISFIAVALSVPFLSAIIGPLALVLTDAIAPTALPATSLTWWMGDVLGALIIAPFLLKWFARPIYQIHRSATQWLETILFFVSTIVVTMLVFWDLIPVIGEIMLPYLVFVPLTWGALRVGPRFMTAGVVTVAVIATIGTSLGVGPFASSSANELLLLQLFLGTVSMIFLLFAAAVEERKRATEELRDHVVTLQEDVEEISEADRAKNEFIAILSHELRNPLAPVLSSLELMRLKTDKMPEFRSAVDTMQEQVGRITRLLDDLLDITRISRKKFDLRVTRVKLQDVLSHSATTAAAEIQKRHHTLTLNLPESPIWIDGDSLRLEQVFVNLLNNAAKYTENGGAITLTALEKTRNAEVRVRDTGIGIAPHLLAAIFEPFRQVSSGGRGSAGLGIGLALAKRFLELHNGSVRVESDGVGKGSEFIVSIPLAVTPLLKAPSPPAHTASPAAPQHTWNLPTSRTMNPHAVKKKKRSVLIVDDNVHAAEGIAKLLVHSGHEVRIAADSAQALERLANFRPDVIILDIGLPGESGYDLARTIRGYLDPQPFLVALTGYGQEDDKRLALEAGFDYHLVKPVSIADLEKILSSS
jgi:signal transduction histidine kinase